MIHEDFVRIVLVGDIGPRPFAILGRHRLLPPQYRPARRVLNSTAAPFQAARRAASRRRSHTRIRSVREDGTRTGPGERGRGYRRR
jgi:hypothetical protein